MKPIDTSAGIRSMHPLEGSINPFPLCEIEHNLQLFSCLLMLVASRRLFSSALPPPLKSPFFAFRSEESLVAFVCGCGTAVYVAGRFYQNHLFGIEVERKMREKDAEFQREMRDKDAEHQREMRAKETEFEREMCERDLKHRLRLSEICDRDKEPQDQEPNDQKHGFHAVAADRQTYKRGKYVQHRKRRLEIEIQRLKTELEHQRDLREKERVIVEGAAAVSVRAQREF